MEGKADDQGKDTRESKMKDDSKTLKLKDIVILEPKDITTGMLFSQGHWVLHIGMALMYFFVWLPVNLTCLPDGLGEYKE